MFSGSPHFLVGEVYQIAARESSLASPETGKSQFYLGVDSEYITSKNMSENVRILRAAPCKSGNL